MSKISNAFFRSLLLLGAVTLTLSACSKDKSGESAMEEMKSKVEESATAAGEAVSNAAESASEMATSAAESAAEMAGNAMESAPDANQAMDAAAEAAAGMKSE